MRLSYTKDFQKYAATALCHILVIIIVAQLVSLATAAPTTLSVSEPESLEPCQQIDCLAGHTVLDTETGECICPGSDSFRLLKIYGYLTRILHSPSILSRRRLNTRQANSTNSKNATDTSSADSPAMTTFIPPPKTDITPALIQQSLSQQPQTLGQISAVQPFFRAGVIQFTMNLVGSAGSSGLLLNASTKIPASTIGANNEPSLVIVPETVTHGSDIVTTKIATIIAINMYSPDFLTYWILLHNGTIVPLLSDCKVHDIDHIDPSTSALSIMPSPLRSKKRDIAIDVQQTADEISQRASLDDGVAKRGLEDVTSYNTMMTQASCATMKCTPTGEKPLWNTFTRSCYCDTDEAYWTVNPSGDTGAVSG